MKINCIKVTYVNVLAQLMEPAFRKKHIAKDKKRDKGTVYATQKHVRIELENQWRHAKNIDSSQKAPVK